MGNYTIKVSASAYLKATKTLTPDMFIGDIDVEDIVLTARYSGGSEMTITVKDYSDAPIANAIVYAWSWAADVYLTATTGENGTATINVPYEDGGTTYDVYASHNDYSLVKNIVVADTTADIEFKLPKKATITGKAVNGEVPVPNTRVTINGSGYSTYAMTNENGEFTADVYIQTENEEFTVSVQYNTKYSGSEKVSFADGETTANITLDLNRNIKVKGTIKNKMAQPVSAYSSITFRGNGAYVTVTPDANGEFETPELFGVGTYNVYSYGSWPYKTISTTFEITEADVASQIKELNLAAEERSIAVKFTSSKNKITATADAIAQGDTVTVNVKFQNDGNSKLSNVTAYAEIPNGTEVLSTNGVDNGEGIVSKDVAELKAYEEGSLTFTLGTENYEDRVIVIPAYVKVDGKEYPIGAVTVEIVSVTLSAPQIVKTNTAFKVSGEAVSGSTVEILNYATKDVLATANSTSRWYFADISGISEDTELIAKVTKDGKTAFSDVVLVEAEDEPISVNDIKVSMSRGDYGKNEYFGYPTFSLWEGDTFSVSVKFNNLPADATVKYSFINKKNIQTTKTNADYYKGTISDWRGFGTKDVVATVTVGDKEYKFIVAEVIILVDPSGYITDSETGNPVVGANVLLEVKSGSDWIKWDAKPHLQENPMLTNENGYYGWMVPEGEYRIIVTADGYETKVVEKYNSRDYGPNSSITVLPVRLDVDIELVKSRTIEVDRASTASVAGRKIKFVFTRPADPSTVTQDNFKVLNSAGEPVAGTVVLAEKNTVALFKPTAAMENGDYKLSVANIKDGAGNVITAEEISFAKTAEITALAAPTVAYNNDGTVTVTFANGKEPVNCEEIVVKNGVSAVSGVTHKAANVITFIPDVAFTAGTTYKVNVSDSIRTDANEYLAQSFEQSFTVPDGQTPSNPGSNGGNGGGGASTYIVSFETNGGSKIENVKVSKNETVSEPKAPTKDGFEFVGWFKDKSLKTKYDFSEAVTESMTLYAAWTEKKDGIDKTEVKISFTDVKDSDWFAANVKFVVENGLMAGISANEFAPNNSLTRAMLVTILYRASGEPAVNKSVPFEDVKSDMYYANAVIWAHQNGIVSGVSETEFAPDMNITREQIAAIMHRYAKFNGYDVSVGENTNILSYTDCDEISEYAVAAMQYAVGSELIKGKTESTLNPKDTATRAEIAAILQRFIEANK